SSGSADGAVSRSRADPAYPAGLPLPRGRCGVTGNLHPLLRLLTGNLARARRDIRPDCRRRRPRHDAPDGVANDDAVVRRVLEVALNILLLGPQGAGKGTQAKRISAEYGIPHVATGDMLRTAITAGTELGKQVEPIVNAGKLVSDELMIELSRARNKLVPIHGNRTQNEVFAEIQQTLESALFAAPAERMAE